VKRLKGNERQLVVTSNGVAGVKGTEYQVSAEGGRMELKVLSGVVELKDPAGKGAVSVPAGHAAVSYADHVGALRAMDRDEVAALRKAFLAQVQQAQGDYLKRVRGINGKKAGTAN
jgi:ferric-dicitrate binding protein FerR (iron transport regulator)